MSLDRNMHALACIKIPLGMIGIARAILGVMEDVYVEADLYCAAFNWPLEEEVRWLLSEFGRITGRQAESVLEPMCGNARYGNVFAGHGVRYHGFDRSPQMLKRATHSSMLRTSTADAVSFEIEGAPFDLGWCPINSIRHITTRDDLIAHLKCMRRHLADDGLYILETDLINHDGPSPTGVSEKPSWIRSQDDGSEVHAWWWMQRGELSTRRIWEVGRFKRFVNGTCSQSVESVYQMLMITCADIIELVNEGGYELLMVVQNDEQLRPVVELSNQLENDDNNYFFFLRPSKG